MRGREIGKLVGSIIACEGAGLIGSVFTTTSISTWYAGLEKPTFTPPNTVFAPVWITLYLLMGVAVYLVWRRDLAVSQVRKAFIVFWVQLVINILWTVVFFGFESLLGGVILIIVLWIAILLTIIWFFRVSRIAGILMIPYIAWVSIAMYLNIGVWILNP